MKKQIVFALLLNFILGIHPTYAQSLQELLQKPNQWQRLRNPDADGAKVEGLAMYQNQLYISINRSLSKTTTLGIYVYKEGHWELKNTGFQKVDYSYDGTQGSQETDNFYALVNFNNTLFAETETGIWALNKEKWELKASYLINSNGTSSPVGLEGTHLRQLFTLNDKLYAASLMHGVYLYKNGFLIEMNQGLPEGYGPEGHGVQELASFRNKLIASTSKNIWGYDGDHWVKIDNDYFASSMPYFLGDLSGFEDKLYIGRSYSNSPTFEIYLLEKGTITPLNQGINGKGFSLYDLVVCNQKPIASTSTGLWYWDNTAWQRFKESPFKNPSEENPTKLWTINEDLLFAFSEKDGLYAIRLEDAKKPNDVNPIEQPAPSPSQPPTSPQLDPQPPIIKIQNDSPPQAGSCSLNKTSNPANILPFLILLISLSLLREIKSRFSKFHE